jgi:hypothetical protein
VPTPVPSTSIAGYDAGSETSRGDYGDQRRMLAWVSLVAAERVEARLTKQSNSYVAHLAAYSKAESVCYEMRSIRKRESPHATDAEISPLL